MVLMHNKPWRYTRLPREGRCDERTISRRHLAGQERLDEPPADLSLGDASGLGLADVPGLQAHRHALNVGVGEIGDALGDGVMCDDLFDFRSSKGSAGSNPRKPLI